MQQGKFVGCHMNSVASLYKGTISPAQEYVSDADRRRFVRYRRAPPLRDGINPRHQFVRAQRLYDAVVGARKKGIQLFLPILTNSQHDNAELRISPTHLPACTDSVGFVVIEIQQNNIKRFCLESSDSPFPGWFDADAESPRFQ